MKNPSLKIYLFLAAFFYLIGTETENALAFQPQTVSANQLRRLFTKAVGQDFEIIKDEMKTRPRDSVSDYWLVHIKPKRSGYYSLKYTYKFVKTSGGYSEEGEKEFGIGVAEKICYRHNNPENGISNVCLGDTVIIPIRTVNLSDHTFSLKSRYQKLQTIEEAQKYYKSRENYSTVEPQFNQLEANVKLLGTRRLEMPHRSRAVTVEYYAVFEAVKPGRFNLGLASFQEDKVPADLVKMNAKTGTPIIIVSPGTPITTLTPGEKTIHYSDNRRFSAYAGNNFLTNLLILQPGDVFTLRYSRTKLNQSFGERFSGKPKIFDIKPAIYKLPFMLDSDWNFNEWLMGHLPKAK